MVEPASNTKKMPDFLAPKGSLNLKVQDRRIAIQALKKLQKTLGVGDAGPRAKEIQERFMRADTKINLMELNTLGLALYRLDTPKAYKLLDKIKTMVIGPRDV